MSLNRSEYQACVDVLSPKSICRQVDHCDDINPNPFTTGISMENNTLVIERVKKDDEGLYECKASNDMGQDSTSAFIKIQGELQDKAKHIYCVGLMRTTVHSWALATFKTCLYI